MLVALQKLIVQSMLLASFAVPGLTGLVGGEQLETLEAKYEQTAQERRAMLEKMRKLEARHEKLVDRIDELKTEGTDNLANRRSVKNLLSQSRELARRLEALQEQVGDMDATLKKLRAEIIRRIDKSVDLIEKRLRDAPADQRAGLVDQLNELRSMRGSYRAPLPEAPDVDEINATLEMVTEVEPGRPDQMQAAADELEDTRDQLRDRLKAVRNHLDQLRRSKTLARRARTFRAEEQFFDEANRPRSVGHHRQGDSSEDTDQGGSQEGGGDRQVADDGPASPGEGDPDGQHTDGQSGAPDESEQAPPAESGDRRDFANDGAKRNDPALDPSNGSQETAGPPQNEPSETTDDSRSGDTDAFDSPEFVLENDADPSTSVSSNFASESELESRIESLEREEKRLNRQAEDLQEKAEKLREKAREMEDVE